MNQPKIACRNVWKLYGPDPEKFLASHDGVPSIDAVREAGYIPAVRDASLEVYEGEIVVLMGLSGSGKSTLVRCLSRLIEPTAGEIDFDGEDLRAASERELVELRRHKMGMVFQHFALFPQRTVLENVAFPLEVQGVDVATRNARALEIIDLVGLHGRGDYYPRELSGGQQQRVGIGRSLAVEPDVWFLDEPFSALDALIRRDMQDEFLRLQSTLQKTIIFITHDFDEAIRLADRIAIMRDGVIDQLGTAEELITNPGSDYVAAFTKNVPRAKLLRVHTLMGPRSDDAEGEVDGSVFVASVANRILSSTVPLRVIEDGEVVGSITAAQVNEALFESE
ncbi:MAG TPA: ABC transporter ATP-binding protein [Acidimicrobiaceae bacterium]|nr:ABC transporter ATP-binding protein [Acidimicrobiaceae bacterium]HCV33945.1 ABC transporter ATP-binding protein [Acidimicrobiaceae bacterium]|tara:strand:- start:894 stop:1904 length:1011 start_codon:yes stop_codon:yes gene_type:complete